MLFINADRDLCQRVISDVRQRLGNDRTALAALDEGVKEAYSGYAGTDYPLHRVLIDSPVVIHDHGEKREPFHGTKILFAALDAEELDGETTYHVLLETVTRLAANFRTDQIRAMLKEFGLADSRLMPRLYRKLLDEAVTRFLVNPSNYKLGRDLMAYWTTERADAVLKAAILRRSDMGNAQTKRLLAAMSADEVRAETLRQRLEQDEANGQKENAAQVRALRGKKANRPPWLRVVK